MWKTVEPKHPDKPHEHPVRTICTPQAILVTRAGIHRQKTTTKKKEEWAHMLTSSYSLLILTCPWRAFLIFSFHIIHTHAHLWGLVIVLFSPLPLLLHSQNLLCYSCFKVYRREFKMLQVLKVLPQLTEMKKSSRSDFFWQYLLPRTAIFVPSIMRRSSERLWIVWETKKKFHNWENEMQTEGISDTMCLMSGCIDGESIVSSRVFNSNHCHHMKKYLPLYFLTLLLLVGKRKI